MRPVDARPYSHGACTGVIRGLEPLPGANLDASAGRYMHPVNDSAATGPHFLRYMHPMHNAALAALAELFRRLTFRS